MLQPYFRVVLGSMGVDSNQPELEVFIRKIQFESIWVVVNCMTKYFQTTVSTLVAFQTKPLLSILCIVTSKFTKERQSLLHFCQQMGLSIFFQYRNRVNLGLSSHFDNLISAEICKYKKKNTNCIMQHAKRLDNDFVLQIIKFE